MNALDTAGYLIELANDTPEHDLTNLKLQKLLYYAQGKYLAQTGHPLFDEKIEAWKYGPVIPDVYHVFKSCGSFPVTVFDVDYNAMRPSAEEEAFLKEIWESLGKKYSGSYLVQTTHAPGTPWTLTYDEESRSAEIPQALMKKYFSTKRL